MTTPAPHRMLRSMRMARAIGVGLVAMILAAYMLASAPGREPGIESHYHFRMGQEIAHGDWAPNPGEHLPWSALGRAFPVDLHWGLHALIAPFGLMAKSIGDDEVAMKVATVAFAIMAILGLYAVLRLFNAPWA